MLRICRLLLLVGDITCSIQLLKKNSRSTWNEFFVLKNYAEAHKKSQQLPVTSIRDVHNFPFHSTLLVHVNEDSMTKNLTQHFRHAFNSSRCFVSKKNCLTIGKIFLESMSAKKNFTKCSSQ